ncbi:MAG: AbrB family transcriptional regulator [Rhodobacteraceae bacterium]|nr:AbrB family transcriptional regulator [Paracoccaceae bacterium]
MSHPSLIATCRNTAITVAVAAGGAFAAWLVSFPAYLLTGSSLGVALASLAGLRLEIAPRLRDVAFVVIGLGIGSTVTAETTEAIQRWPLAFVVLGLALVVMMALCSLLLQHGFGFDRRSAVLASAPGHLSFVVALSAELGLDGLRVVVVQAVRLLSLTLLVPIMAWMAGVTMTGLPLAGIEGVMPWSHMAVLGVLSVAVGVGLGRLRVPAALLVGAMTVSGVAHGAGWTHGGLNPALATVSFVVLGGLIGTRFVGVGFATFRSALGAGLAITLLASLVSGIAALVVAWAIGMQLSSVLAAFAPGSFETMIALGAVLGANPGFVAASHVARLLMLTVLIPLALGRAPR